MKLEVRSESGRERRFCFGIFDAEIIDLVAALLDAFGILVFLVFEFFVVRRLVLNVVLQSISAKVDRSGT